MYCRLIYVLTAVGLTPGGGSAVHIYLHTNSTQNNTVNLVRVWAVPCLCEFDPCVCLTAEGNVRKTLRQGSRRVPVGTVKTNIQERAYITIRIHKRNNKNTYYTNKTNASNGAIYLPIVSGYIYIYILHYY